MKVIDEKKIEFSEDDVRRAIWSMFHNRIVAIGGTQEDIKLTSGLYARMYGIEYPAYVHIEDVLYNGS